MRSGTRVENPRVGVVKRYSIESGDKAGLVPSQLDRPCRRWRGVWPGEGSVSLRIRPKYPGAGSTPGLLLSCLGREAHPWCSLAWSRGRESAGAEAVAAVVLSTRAAAESTAAVAAGVAVVVAAAVLALVLAAVAAVAAAGAVLLLPTAARGVASAPGAVGVGAVGCDEGSLGLDLYRVGVAKLLENQRVPRIGEGRQDRGARDVVGRAGEARVDAAEEVEDELGLGDGVANVAEGISRRLHALTIVGDGEIALGHGVELVMQIDRARLLVGLKEVVDGDPQVPSRLIGLHGEVEDVVGDRAEEPAAEAAIGLFPGSVGVGGRSSVKMIEETKFPTHRAEEGLPLVVVGVTKLEGDRNMGLDGDGRIRVDENRGDGRGGRRHRSGVGGSESS